MTNWPRRLRRAALLAAACLPLSACGTPHTHAEGLLGAAPDPGYAWLYPETMSREVRWVPGASHPGFPNIVAAAAPDRWRPLPGYAWNDAAADPAAATAPRPSAAALAVHWQQGLGHPSLPHLRSGATPGQWRAGPG
jgi:hypothetical protein